MSFLNGLTHHNYYSSNALSILVRLLAPFAPHISEELWKKLGNKDTIAFAEWPQFDIAKTIDDTVSIAIQVNGKLRSVIDAPRSSPEEEIKVMALENKKVQSSLEGKSIVKVIFVPDKLLNLVIRG